MASGYLLGSMCMRFRYHMYGEDIGSLSVFRNGDGVMQQLLWQQDGNQGNTWHEAELYIDCNVTRYLVSIKLKCDSDIFQPYFAHSSLSGSDPFLLVYDAELIRYSFYGFR